MKGTALPELPRREAAANFEFSHVGPKLTARTAILLDLMDDLGRAVATPGMRMLGGGNPAAVPEMQALVTKLPAGRVGFAFHCPAWPDRCGLHSPEPLTWCSGVYGIAGVGIGDQSAAQRVGSRMAKPAEGLVCGRGEFSGELAGAGGSQGRRNRTPCTAAGTRSESGGGNAGGGPEGAGN